MHRLSLLFLFNVYCANHIPSVTHLWNNLESITEMSAPRSDIMTILEFTTMRLCFQTPCLFLQQHNPLFQFIFVTSIFFSRLVFPIWTVISIVTRWLTCKHSTLGRHFFLTAPTIWSFVTILSMLITS